MTPTFMLPAPHLRWFTFSLLIYFLMVIGTSSSDSAASWIFLASLVLMCIAAASRFRDAATETTPPTQTINRHWLSVQRVIIFLIPAWALSDTLLHLRGSAFVMFAIMLAIVLSYFRAGPSWFTRNRAWILIAIFAAMGVFIVFRARIPEIDVWEFQMDAIRYLLALKNPYSQLYPNIYGPDTPFYSAAVLVDHGRYVHSYPYTPMTMLVGIPGYLLGDVRWVHLASVVACPVFLVLALREAGFAAGHFSELLPLSVLAHPNLLYLVDQSWTESLLAAWTAVFVWAAVRNPKSTLTWISLGVMFALKQYTVLFLPLLFFQSVIPRTSVIKATALAALSLAPFFISDFSNTLFGLVQFQILQPFRPDSISAQVWFARHFGHPMPWWEPLVLVVLSYPFLLFRKGNLSLSYLLFGAEFILMVLVYFNKQAFFNYYWYIAILALCVALLELVRLQGSTTERIRRDVTAS